jgi:hypothetical protein
MLITGDNTVTACEVFVMPTYGRCYTLSYERTIMSIVRQKSARWSMGFATQPTSRMNREKGRLKKHA